MHGLLSKISWLVIGSQLLFYLHYFDPDSETKAANFPLAGSGEAPKSNLAKAVAIRKPPSFRSKHFIYYNIYVPGKNLSQNAREIVEEQLRTIARRSETRKQKFALRYTLIWDKKRQGAIRRISNIIRSNCEEYSKYMSCQRVSHHRHGMEDLSLTNVYDHCVANPGHHVSYIHDKGSHRPTPYQHINRRKMTEAAFSDSCLDGIDVARNNSGQQQPQCNVCGHFYVPIWNFMAGNMWTARCDYVRNLIAPNMIDSKMAELNAAREAEHQHKRLLANFIPAEDYSLGRKRYSHELWVTTHPNLKPCDTKGAKKGTSDGALRAPRLPITDQKWRDLMSTWNYNRYKFTLLNKSYRMRDYFLLPGLLFRYAYLYNNSRPVDDSWVWKWFPDADFWKEETRGSSGLMATVQNVTALYATAERLKEAFDQGGVVE